MNPHTIRKRINPYLLLVLVWRQTEAARTSCGLVSWGSTPPRWLRLGLRMLGTAFGQQKGIRGQMIIFSPAIVIFNFCHHLRSVNSGKACPGIWVIRRPEGRMERGAARKKGHTKEPLLHRLRLVHLTVMWPKGAH
jgi:hypothetical protein